MVRPWGMAAGLTGVASVLGLLAPALDEGSTADVLVGLAAGAMVSLVALELVPQAFTPWTWRPALTGAGAMVVLSALVGV